MRSRSAARVRTFSGSQTRTGAWSGRWSTSIVSLPECSTGRSDSIPSTQIPSASLASISPTPAPSRCPSSLPETPAAEASSAARARTWSVRSSSRQGIASTESTCSSGIERWSATEK
ncbi:Uncharacterised protein [Mycobacteroides abscessus subsp. abscessus]|nr:Uncharacterised protein [Mycobacteroides abscessus subsp. abscessus]